MDSFKSKISVAATLVGNGAEYYLEVGSMIDEIIVAGPYEDMKISGAELTGIELKRREVVNPNGRIYDSIPCNGFITDGVANLFDASKMLDVKAISVKFTDEKVGEIERRIPVSRIKSMSGSFTAPDGSKTISVDPAEKTIAEVVAEATAEGDVPVAIILPEAEITEELTVEKALTVIGVNADIPQNFKQEVA